MITVRAAKTEAGTRRVDLLPVLRDELATYKAGVLEHPDGRVFPTSTGNSLNPSNTRNRILKLSIKRANKRLVEAGLVPLPEGLTPHKLRHTYTSLLAALGTDTGAIMDQLGHRPRIHLPRLPARHAPRPGVQGSPPGARRCRG
jgi:integrase